MVMSLKKHWRCCGSSAMAATHIFPQTVQNLTGEKRRRTNIAKDSIGRRLVGFMFVFFDTLRPLGIDAGVIDVFLLVVVAVMMTMLNIRFIQFSLRSSRYSPSDGFGQSPRSCGSAYKQSSY